MIRASGNTGTSGPPPGIILELCPETFKSARALTGLGRPSRELRMEHAFKDGLVARVQRVHETREEIPRVFSHSPLIARDDLDHAFAPLRAARTQAQSRSRRGRSCRRAMSGLTRPTNVTRPGRVRGLPWCIAPDRPAAGRCNPGVIAQRSSSPTPWSADHRTGPRRSQVRICSSCARNAAKPRNRSPDCGYSPMYSGWIICLERREIACRDRLDVSLEKLLLRLSHGYRSLTRSSRQD